MRPLNRAVIEALDSRLLMTATRDPWLNPFATGSIWNTPVGNAATYVPAQLGTLGLLGGDNNYIFRENPADPLLPVLRPDNIPVTNPTTIRVPADLTVGSGPNNASAWLKTDGVTIQQYSPFTVTNGANPRGFTYQTLNITTSTGELGSHAGSGLSGLGGTLRTGELTSSEPINHSLQIEIDWAQLWRNTANPANMQQTYRWPAIRSDTNFGGTYNATTNNSVPAYTGTVPGLSMGALLALTPSLTETGLGLTTVAGKKLFHALQDYGAYVVDTSNKNPSYRPNGGFYANIAIEPEAKTEFSGVNRYGFNAPSTSTLNQSGADAWYADVRAIYTNLSWINNNAPGAIGGGVLAAPNGSRRGPTPPPFGVSLPETPSNLTVSTLTPGAATLTWSDNATNETGYVVERATDRSFGTNLITVATLGPDVTTYTNTFPSRGPVYFYRVHAINASGASVDTLPVQVTTSTSTTTFATAASPTNGTGVASSLATGNSGGTVGLQQSAVFGIQLPAFGSVANPFSSATFNVTTPSQSGAFSFNAGNKYALVGLTGVTTDPSIVNGYYSAAGTTINSNFITTATFGGNLNPNVSTNLSQDVTTWLNTQYAGGANAGKYVFLRVTSNVINAQFSQVRFSPNAAINFTLIPAATAVNKLVNGSFETDSVGYTGVPTGWTRSASAATSIVTTGVTDGTQAAKVTVSDFSASNTFQGKYGVLSQDLSTTLTAGQTYRLTGGWSGVTGGFGASGALYYNGVVFNFSSTNVDFTFTYNGGFAKLQLDLVKFSGTATTASVTFDNWKLVQV